MMVILMMKRMILFQWRFVSVGVCFAAMMKPSWKSLFEGDLKETGPPTMDYFHTQLFYKLSLVSKEKVRFKAVIRCKRTSIACQKRMAGTRKSKIQDHHFQVIWILCEPSRVPCGLELPKALAEKMLVATRFK